MVCLLQKNGWNNKQKYMQISDISTFGIDRPGRQMLRSMFIAESEKGSV